MERHPMKMFVLTENRQPYRVRHACGHLERRMMREVIAGIPWTETAEVAAGNKCQHCTRDDRGHTQEGSPCTVRGCQVIPEGDVIDSPPESEIDRYIREDVRPYEKDGVWYHNHTEDSDFASCLGCDDNQRVV
jgi:hypothetical protein